MIPTHRSRSRVLPALLVSVLTSVLGCSGTPREARPPAPRSSFLVSAQMIQESGAATAWEALRLTVPVLQFKERRGLPVRISRRGRSSILLDDQPRVIVDFVHVYDLRLLDMMPAMDIATIEVLSGLEATTYYGGSSSSGVIVIRTKTGAN